MERTGGCVELAKTFRGEYSTGSLRGELAEQLTAPLSATALAIRGSMLVPAFWQQKCVVADRGPWSQCSKDPFVPGQ